MAAALVVIAASAVLYFKLDARDPVAAFQQPQATADLADPEQLPPIRVGERVEALSTDGWQQAKVLALTDGDTAEVDYDSAQLPNERLDIRLVRRIAQPFASELETKTTTTPQGLKRTVLSSGADTLKATGASPAVVKGAPDSAEDVPIANVESAFVGCFNDTSALELNGFLERSATNTPQTCIQKCRKLGYAFAGVQYGESCLCGNEYGKHGKSDRCDYPCTGDPTQTCGGYGTNAIYRTGNPRPIEERLP